MKTLKRRSFVHTVLLAGLMVFPILGVSAQKHPYDDRGILAVNAKVEGVRLVEENAALISFRISVSYRFVNRGLAPALLYVGEAFPWSGGAYLANSKQNSLLHSYVYSSSAWLSRDTQAYVEALRKLDQSAPPSELIHVIEPGKYWDYRGELGLTIEKMGSFDKSSKPWDEIRQSEQLWLRVQFQTWPRNFEKNMGHPTPKFGLRLQKRWKAKGELILENIYSEPVPLNLGGGWPTLPSSNFIPH